MKMIQMHILPTVYVLCLCLNNVVVKSNRKERALSDIVCIEYVFKWLNGWRNARESLVISTRP